MGNHQQALRVIFMGTPDFSVPALQSLIDSHHDVVAVYTQPPRPKGRGKKLAQSPVHQLADQYGLPVYHPVKLKKQADAVAQFAALNADIAIVAAYGIILPVEILQAPKFGCLNIHASILPRWRGASPIQQAIWAGDKQSGVTIMQMEQGLDTGPMLSKQYCDIPDDMTATQLHDVLSDMGAKMLAPILDGIAAGTPPVPDIQNDDLACYAPLLTKDDGRVDWRNNAIAIDRQIRALTPWPGVWAMVNGSAASTPAPSPISTPSDQLRVVKILSASIIADFPLDSVSADARPGQLLDKKGHVKCGDNTIIKLEKIHPHGAQKPMDIPAALNGHYLAIGDILT